MKASALMEELFGLASDADYSNTCDTCKAGDPDIEINKVAVTMFATPDVIKQATSWGAQLLITHEPTYYDHMDEHSDDPIECKKRQLIQDSGLTIYRYHDHPHRTKPDMICYGEIRELQLPGEVHFANKLGQTKIYLHHPMTARELAELIEERLHIRHLRICGACDIPSTKISLIVGAPGDTLRQLQDSDCEILLAGEICEWRMAEYARDAAQLGYNKSLIIMGHVGSERDGMKYITDVIRQKHPELAVEYFECGEVYQYTK